MCKNVVFIQETFTELLLCAKCYAEPWGDAEMNQTVNSALGSGTGSWGVADELAGMLRCLHKRLIQGRRHCSYYSRMEILLS